MDEIAQSMVFCDWLLSLSIMLSRVSHAAAWVSTSFLFMANICFYYIRLFGFCLQMPVKRWPVRRTNLTASLTPRVGRPLVLFLDQPGWEKKRQSHAGRSGGPGCPRQPITRLHSGPTCPSALQPWASQQLAARETARVSSCGEDQGSPSSRSWSACVSREPGQRLTR